MNLIMKLSPKKLLMINLFLFIGSNSIILISIIINIIRLLPADNLVNIGTSIGVGIFFRLCIILGLTIEAYKGKNWARWGIVILSCLTGLYHFRTLLLFNISIYSILLFIIDAIIILSMTMSKKINIYYQINIYRNID